MAAECDPAVRLNTIQKLLEGYGSRSVPRLLAPLARNFRHRVLPESLQMGDWQDRAAFAEKAAGIFGLFAEFRMVPLSAAQDPWQGTVVVHARMEGVFYKRGEDDDGEEGGGEGESEGSSDSSSGNETDGSSRLWRNECILMIRLTSDGTQVAEIQEFVDSAKALEMRKRAPDHFAGSEPECESGGF